MSAVPPPVWDFEPVVWIATAAVLGVYARGAWRRRHAARDGQGVRHALFAAGAIGAWLAIESPLAALADHLSFVHQVQHLVLMAIGPMLVALSAPEATLAAGLGDRAIVRPCSRTARRRPSPSRPCSSTPTCARPSPGSRPRLVSRRKSGSATPTALTCASPSAASGGGWPVAHADFLPLDRRADARRTLDALDPAILVIGRCDVWPELMRETARRGIPIALVGATVRANSARLRWPARAAYRNVLGGLGYPGPGPRAHPPPRRHGTGHRKRRRTP